MPGLEFCWLALLVTGNRRRNLKITPEAMYLRGYTNLLSSWMLAWSRRVVIAEALADTRNGLVTSARRAASRHSEEIGIPSLNWIIDPGTTRVQIESAVEAIDRHLVRKTHHRLVGAYR